MSIIESTIHKHAVEVDTRLADAYSKRHSVSVDISLAEDTLHRTAGHRWHYESRRSGSWSGTIEEAIACTEFRTPWDAKAHAEAVTKRTELREQYAVWSSLISDLNADWRANGCWSRFYLVCNSNGHIHSSVNCSTCFDSTAFSWLTNLSGLTEADAVAQEGEVLCTVCFPTAPVSWTNGVSRRDAEAKAKREAEKAQRLAEKAKKSLSLDGSVVEISITNEEREKVRYCHSNWKEFKTLRSAELWLVDAYAHSLSVALGRDKCWVLSAPDAYSEDNVLHVVNLCAQKTGISTDEVIANAVQKAGKRVKENTK